MRNLPALLVATALATAALTGCGSTPAPAAAPGPTQPSAPSSTEVSATHPTSHPTVPGTVLGPNGYGSLEIGMSDKVATATGLVAHDARGTHLAGHPDAGLCLSKAEGLMAIFLGRGMRTSEGAGLGSSMAELRAAYPDLRPYGVAEPGQVSGIYRATAGDGTWYEIDVDDRGRAYVVILRQDHQTCFE